MDIERLEGITVFILESLHRGDIRTGKNLCDEIRQCQYDYREIHIGYKYYDLENEFALQEKLLEIEKEVAGNNYIPIIQLECHGYDNGIELASNEHILWLDFFNYIRPVNIASCNLLLLNLSMCNGAAVIRGIDPRKRAPFRAVIGPEDKAYPEDLQAQWSNFYNRFFLSLNKGSQDSICESAVSNKLVYYNQDFVFDVHYDTPNLYPELFEQWINTNMFEMCKEGGPLLLDPIIYKKWMAKELKKVFEKYRPYYCFYDYREKLEYTYNRLK